MNRLDGILRTCEHPGRGPIPGPRAHAEMRLEAATAAKVEALSVDFPPYGVYLRDGVLRSVLEGERPDGPGIPRKNPQVIEAATAQNAQSMAESQAAQATVQSKERACIALLRLDVSAQVIGGAREPRLRRQDVSSGIERCARLQRLS